MIKNEIIELLQLEQRPMKLSEIAIILNKERHAIYRAVSRHTPLIFEWTKQRGRGKSNLVKLAKQLSEQNSESQELSEQLSEQKSEQKCSLKPLSEQKPSPEVFTYYRGVKQNEIPTQSPKELLTKEQEQVNEVVERIAKKERLHNIAIAIPYNCAIYERGEGERLTSPLIEEGLRYLAEAEGAQVRIDRAWKNYDKYEVAYAYLCLVFTTQNLIMIPPPYYGFVENTREKVYSDIDAVRQLVQYIWGPDLLLKSEATCIKRPQNAFEENEIAVEAKRRDVAPISIKLPSGEEIKLWWDDSPPNPPELEHEADTLETTEKLGSTIQRNLVMIATQDLPKIFEQIKEMLAPIPKLQSAFDYLVDGRRTQDTILAMQAQTQKTLVDFITNNKSGVDAPAQNSKYPEDFIKKIFGDKV